MRRLSPSPSIRAWNAPGSASMASIMLGGITWLCRSIRMSAIPFLFSVLGEPIESFVRRVHDDALNTGVGLISGNAVLTTHPAVLESSPWRRRIDSVVSVDPHDSHVQRTREPVRSADITRPDTPGHAKWGRGGELDGMRFPVEWKDAGDRTKD